MTETFKKINENTSVPFKIVIPIVSAAVACTLWLTSELEQVKAIGRESWTQAHQRAWVAELRDENPQVSVPDVDIMLQGIEERHPRVLTSPHQKPSTPPPQEQ